MGAFKYTITVESDTPPQILLGQNLGGAIVTKLEQEKQELVSAAHHLCKVMLKMTATFYLNRSDPFFDTNPDTMMTQI